MSKSPPTNGKPWYHKGLRFECIGCGNCCSGDPGYVWVNKKEIAAMATALGVEVESFEKQYVRLVGVRKSLTELSDGDCMLFDGQRRGCRVYEARPRQCRTWPFWTSNLRTPEEWDDVRASCPGADCGPGFSLQQIQARLQVVKSL